MFESIPPGPKFLLKFLPSLTLPFLLVYGTSHVYTIISSSSINPSTLQWLYSLCLPLFYTAYFTLEDVKDSWDAWRNGAVMPPRIRSWLPGNILSIIQLVAHGETGYLGEKLEEASKEKGYLFNFRSLFQNRFMTVEPEYIKYILATRFENHEKGRPVRDSLSALLGVGVFASDGDMWKFHRQLTRPFFARDRISDFEIFEKHSSDAIDLMKSRLNEGFAVDFQDLVSRFTLDSATEFLCAQDVQSLASGLPYPYTSAQYRAQSESSMFTTQVDRFTEAFNVAAYATAQRIQVGGAWPLFEFWKDRMKAPMKVIHGYIQPVIRDALERRDAKRQDEIEENSESLLDYLVTQTEDPIIIRDEVLNILIAGRDTTAASLTLVIYLLAQHPEVFQRLRQEILDKLGSDRRPTFDDFRDMKYLRAVINETLRLYPVVPFNLKSTIKAQVWPNIKSPSSKPYWIPAHSRLPQFFVALHRRKDLWGEDALEFDPDRFLDDRLHKYLIPNPYIFLPFNAGPRICLGQQFAYHEASYFLVRLLQQFSSVSFALDAQPPDTLAPEEWKSSTLGRKSREVVKMRSHLTTVLQGGLWVRMEEASETESV